MMKRFMNKKVVATAAVVGLALGGAGIASAYILGNGSATGSASVGNGAANGFSVSSPSLQGGPLSIDPNNFDTISSSISNFTGLPLTLKPDPGRDHRDHGGCRNPEPGVARLHREPVRAGGYLGPRLGRATDDLEQRRAGRPGGGVDVQPAPDRSQRETT